MLELNKIYQGDCLEVMKTFPDNSVDSIVTDPPYELGFMGKSWDNTGIANNKEMWKECLRVLKPGGYLLSFGGTRTYHRMASAIEDAGFEVRDMIEWVYSTGFPKSLNIGKAVDKLQGNEREVRKEIPDRWTGKGNVYQYSQQKENNNQVQITKGNSEWEGWGTALKPAHEPICMARKPLSEKTVAENVLKWGTGGINIDESRVETTEETRRAKSGWQDNGYVGGEYDNKKYDAFKERENNGRFPANLIHDGSEEVRECFPETKGDNRTEKSTYDKGIWGNAKPVISNALYSDNGNASRYFKSIIYQAKSSKAERTNGGTITNKHPTIKPIKLMEYLIKMVTPKGGIVLDPFAGSGTTGVACKNLNRNYILIEKEPEYVKIAEERLSKLNNGNDGIPPKPKDLGILPTTI